MAPALRLKIDAKTLAIMDCVDALERSHASGAAGLRPFLEGLPDDYRLDALSELVRVDFERQSRRGARPSIAQYFDEYPELTANSAAAVELLQVEFDARQQAGEQPSIDEFRRIHPDFRPAGDTNASALITSRGLSDDVRPVPAPEIELQRIGKYALVRQLGAGGFGIVYEAHDDQLERSVAIKVRHGHDGQSGLSDDLLHEARSIAQLDHPNIVRLLEAGETPEGLGYVVYEYVDGETLQQALDRNEYNRAEAVEWVAQIADALHYAHQRRIVHRDVKPANILLDSQRRPKVVDFGLARRNDQFFKDEAGQIVGTLAYLSPEQANGDSDWASAQSDLYSLGVVLYELLCKWRPFHAPRIGDMLDQIVHRTPPPPRSVDDTIPSRLEDACLKALAKRPADRFKTGNEMASALRSAMQPRSALLGKVARYAAALVAVAALCLLIVSLRIPTATVAAPKMPEFGGYNLLLADTETPVNSHLPLASGAPLKVEASFTTPAYAYLIVFEQGGVGHLIWPAQQQLAEQKPISRLIYPPLSGDAAPMLVPKGDGATFVVVLANHEPLDPTALAEVLAARLELGVSPEIAAQSETSFQVAEPSPGFHQGLPTRGAGAREATRLRVPDPFKEVLARHSDSYLGNLVPHANARRPAAN